MTADGALPAPTGGTRATAAPEGPGGIAALQVLAAWLSPGYPVGAYSFSHGLETTIESGALADAAGLADWLTGILAHGAGRSDVILLAHAARAPDDPAIPALAAALAPSAERRRETLEQGAAFARITSAAWGLELRPAAYPVAVGHAVAALGLPLQPAATLYLQAFAANLISAGVRLVPLGQSDGQRVLAGLLPLIADTAAEAAAAPLGEIGGLALAADLASMEHETLYSRLYRS